MRRITRRLALVMLASGLLALSGCTLEPGMFHEKKFSNVNGGIINTVNVSATSRKQRIKVIGITKGTNFDMCVVYQEDLKKASEQLKSNMAPDEALACKMNTADPELELDIPAKKAFTVLIRNASEGIADITLEIRGQ